MQQIDLSSISQNPLPCTCPGSESLYAPCDHVMTGDLSIVQNEKNLELFYTKAQNSGNLSHFHGTRTLKLDACEAYARQWVKKEDVELDTLSED